MTLVFAFDLGSSSSEEIDIQRVVYCRLWASSATSSMGPKDRRHITGIWHIRVGRGNVG